MSLSIDEIKALAIETHGKLPVIAVFEHPHPLRSINLFLIDLEKLTDEYSMEFSYVSDIVQKAIEGYEEIDTPRKYSFSDTKEWWKGLMPDEITHANLTVRIKVNIN